MKAKVFPSVINLLYCKYNHWPSVNKSWIKYGSLILKGRTSEVTTSNYLNKYTSICIFLAYLKKKVVKNVDLIFLTLDFNALKKQSSVNWLYFLQLCTLIFAHIYKKIFIYYFYKTIILNLLKENKFWSQAFRIFI